MLTLMRTSQYPGHEAVDLQNAGDLVNDGPSAGYNTDIAGESLDHPDPVPGANFNNHHRPAAIPEASGSASAEPAASRTPSPKVLNCEHCGSISAKTPRDFNRHLDTKKHRKNASKNNRENGQLESSANPGAGFRCPVTPCDGVFSRKDNLWRHIANAHGISERENC